MKKYIKSDSSASSKYQIQWVKSEYLGGNMVGAYGQLADGTYFYGNDADCYVWFVDADPTEMLQMRYGDEMNEWLAAHDIGDGHTEKDGYRFWIDLLNYCKADNLLGYYPAYNEKTSAIDDYEYAYDQSIKELQELI